jgi:hypothetical protein
MALWELDKGFVQRHELCEDVGVLVLVTTVTTFGTISGPWVSRVGSFWDYPHVFMRRTLISNRYQPDSRLASGPTFFCPFSNNHCISCKHFSFVSWSLLRLGVG